MKSRHYLATAVLSFAGTSAFAAGFSLQSPQLPDQSKIKAEHYWNNFGCTGGNVMPELKWKNPPVGTQSFAITLHDKDAPTGSGFWHWVVYDIASATTGLPGGVNAGALPAGAKEGNTDLGKPGFFGPCPPVGREHRYTFTIHALKVDKLPVEAGASPALVGFTIWQNSLGKSSFQVKAGPRQ